MLWNKHNQDCEITPEISKMEQNDVQKIYELIMAKIQMKNTGEMEKSL